MNSRDVAQPIALLFAGIHQNPNNVNAHAHPCPELILIMQGDCDVDTDETTLHTGPGDLIVMPARTMHNQISNGYIHTVYVGFTDHAIGGWSQSQVLRLGKAMFIEQCMLLLAAVGKQEAQASAEAACHVLSAVLRQIDYRRQTMQQAPVIPSGLRLAMQYLHDNIDKPISIGSLAEHVRMSPSNLYTLFRSHLDISPMRYLLTQRMRRARSYLSDPYLSVKEIAALCGYEDVNLFVRTFRKAHGRPPGKWRQQHILSNRPLHS